MTFYEVVAWDDMASNYGDSYVAGRFLVRKEAEQLATTLNAARVAAYPNVSESNLHLAVVNAVEVQ